MADVLRFAFDVLILLFVGATLGVGLMLVVVPVLRREVRRVEEDD